MQRVRGPVGDGAAGRDQRLPQYLAAEYRPGADILVGAAKQVAVEALQIEKMQQLLGIHDNQTAGGYYIRAACAGAGASGDRADFPRAAS